PFIYFFQKLYPFAWANDPRARTAAAAGGCVLLRRPALERIGGLGAIRHALIDDCSLAAAVKRSGAAAGGVWIGLATEARSIRPSAGLGSIWAIVARAAHSQLRHSPLILAGTLVGMVLTYLVPPLRLLSWPWHGEDLPAALGGLAWLLMALSLLPTLRLYRQPLGLAPLLPLAAALYWAMTFDASRLHSAGRGGRGEGRAEGRP